MEDQGLAVHRTIVAVDVEGFGARYRTNRNQVAVRDGLYQAVREAFQQAGIPWADHDHEDRGDGMLILVGSEVPKSLFVETLPSALVSALSKHNRLHPEPERIRLRMALHAGEVNYDTHGATAASINLAFRLLESGSVKEALAGSSGILAVIVSSWFFDEVVRHSRTDAAEYYPVPVTVKETTTTGWVRLPGHVGSRGDATARHLSAFNTTTAEVTAARLDEKTRRALSLAYRSALTESITPAGDIPAGLGIPDLGDGYVDHRARVAEVTSSSAPSEESWWNEVPVTDGICDFLLTRLTMQEMLMNPIVLLGQPGSGKSVLTRILAARLSAAGFLAVRVELRQAPAEADLQEQIEFAIRSATGERIQWSELATSEDHAPAAVIFDGFDELLQATGVVQNDFLLRVQEFQEREARLDRPVAVIVTSRTAVTDRARIPHGATAVRLEPFDKKQITIWLEIWARTNYVALAGRNMKPLPVDVALRYKELAEQPLLLLMLALYDADANVLQHRSTTLSRTELYGQLLKDFASREIHKASPALARADLKRAVDDEMLRLSVVAFAMFNRRSQWVPEVDLDADFSTLLIDNKRGRPGPGNVQAKLTQAQLTIGRFFFVHESRATHDNRQLRTYEFLHATFGEFLVAHHVVRVLTDMLAQRTAHDLPQPDGEDSGMLHALLSFAALTTRTPVVGFIADLFDKLDAQQRTAITDFLLQLHIRALFPRGKSAFSRYEPLALTVTARNAAWSANLVVLAVLAAGEITGSQLFPDAPDTAGAWRTEAMMWRSQLGGHGWEGLHETITMTRVWDDQRRGIRLGRTRGQFVHEAVDLLWIFDVSPDPQVREGVSFLKSHDPLLSQRKINFACNMSEDILSHIAAPSISSFPATFNVFIMLDNEHVVSAIHALLSAFYAPYQEDRHEDSAYLDLAQVVRKLSQAPTQKTMLPT